MIAASTVDGDQVLSVIFLSLFLLADIRVCSFSHDHLCSAYVCEARRLGFRAEVCCLDGTWFLIFYLACFTESVIPSRSGSTVPFAQCCVSQSVESYMLPLLSIWWYVFGAWYWGGCMRRVA